MLLVVSNPVDILTHLAAHFATQRGVPLARVARASIRSIAGTVLQQPFLYSKKLRDNIVAGMQDSAARSASVATMASWPSTSTATTSPR